jgi:hypothetical protein
MWRLIYAPVIIIEQGINTRPLVGAWAQVLADYEECLCSKRLVLRLCMWTMIVVTACWIGTKLQIMINSYGTNICSWSIWINARTNVWHLDYKWIELETMTRIVTVYGRHIRILMLSWEYNSLVSNVWWNVWIALHDSWMNHSMVVRLVGSKYH